MNRESLGKLQVFVSKLKMKESVKENKLPVFMELYKNSIWLVTSFMKNLQGEMLTEIQPLQTNGEEHGVTGLYAYALLSEELIEMFEVCQGT